jgi:PQQ enzyme-like repeat protein
MASRATPVFVGIKGSVLAIDRATGQTLWQADLKGSDFAAGAEKHRRDGAAADGGAAAV